MATPEAQRPPPTDDMLKRVGLTRERFEEMRERQIEREARAPKVGDRAPDFDLPVLSNRDESVRLSGFRGQKPVALIFGSYT